MQRQKFGCVHSVGACPIVLQRDPALLPTEKGGTFLTKDADEAGMAFSHPHDLLVRNMLADADLAADLLCNYLDPDLIGLLDLDSLKCESPVAVDKNLAEAMGDLRYSTLFKGTGQRLRVFVFLEHQSKPDRFMSFRLLEYVCKAYRQHISDKDAAGKKKTFPYPLAIVLHQGKKPWDKVPPMRELIDSVPGVDLDILKLPVFLIDLPRIAPEQLKGSPAVCALLDSLQSAATGRLAERYEEIVARLATVKNDSRVHSWLTALTKYTMAQCHIRGGLATIRRVLDKIYSKKEAEKMELTLAEELRLEGEARGKAKGKAESLIRILTKRFGTIPASVEKKISAIHTPERIDELTDVAVTCDSLAAFKKAL